MNPNSDVFFSIIVPVYNVQDYLQECVESVLKQKFTDYELILVDDGSRDQSGAMCDAFAQQDERIRVLHQKNGGASAARNNGLQMARGRYILFLDSDDFYPQIDFLGELFSKHGEKDVVCFNYSRYKDRLLPVLLNFPETADLNTDELLLELVRRNAFTSSPCLKAVRREVLIHNGITFEEGTSGEDIEWNAKVMCAAKHYAFAPGCIYAYRVRESSVTQNISAEYVNMLCRIVSRLAASPASGSEAFCSAYNSYIAFQYCTILINARLCRPRLSRQKMREIREMSWLLQYDANRIVKLIHTVYKLLGFEITSWLLLIYFKLFC